MCDETRRQAATDPARITLMLESFEEMLALLAPILERLGDSPGVSRDAVLAAARNVAGRHDALMDAMSLELERLARAIAETDNAAHATVAYDSAQPGSSRVAFEARG